MSGLRHALSHDRAQVGAAAVRPRGGRGPVMTYALIVVCCLIFLIGPASGLDPALRHRDALLAAQRTTSSAGAWSRARC